MFTYKDLLIILAPLMLTMVRDVMSYMIYVIVITLIKVLGFKFDFFGSNICPKSAALVEQNINKNTLYASEHLHIIGKEKIPSGIIVGKNFVAFKEVFTSDFDERKKLNYKIYIIQTKNSIVLQNLETFKLEKEVVSPLPNSKPILMKYLVQSSAYKSSDWVIRQKKLYGQPTITQEKIMNFIREKCEESEKNNYPYGIVVFINGSKGVGKSEMTRFLTKEISGVLCDSFKPTEYGSVFEDVYNSSTPRKDQPLVLVFNEVDTLFASFHKEDHRSYRRDVDGKDTWNNFLDKLSTTENLVTILTSNLNYEQISEKYDESFLRMGRVHFYIEMELNKFTIRKMETNKFHDKRFDQKSGKSV